MRALRVTLQVALFALAVYGAWLVLREIGMKWDDWVVFGVLVFGVLWLAKGLYYSDYPSRSRKRRFGRSSGPDAPVASGGKGRRRP